MPNLRTFTLGYDEQNEDWVLKNDLTNRSVRRFDTKEDATQGGVLEKAVGQEGGSVRIQKQDGRYQEERTYPGSRDPFPPRG